MQRSQAPSCCECGRLTAKQRVCMCVLWAKDGGNTHPCAVLALQKLSDVTPTSHPPKWIRQQDMVRTREKSLGSDSPCPKCQPLVSNTQAPSLPPYLQNPPLPVLPLLITMVPAFSQVHSRDAHGYNVHHSLVAYPAAQPPQSWASSHWRPKMAQVSHLKRA